MKNLQKEDVKFNLFEIFCIIGFGCQKVTLLNVIVIMHKKNLIKGIFQNKDNNMF